MNQARGFGTGARLATAHVQPQPSQTTTGAASGMPQKPPMPAM
jgi:hypothetical protein